MIDFKDSNKAINQNQVISKNIENKTNNLRNKNECRSSWIIICNPSYYDVIGAFNELERIEWKQSVNIKAGDIVYIYVGNPFKEIKYKCIATKVDLNSAERIDDSKFILDDSNYKNYGRYMELKLLTKYNDQQYPFIEIRKNGLNSVQGPSWVSNKLENYIKLIEINLIKTSLEENYNEDEILLKEIKTIEHRDFNEYQGKKKEEQKPKIEDSVRVYKRDKKVSMNALSRANYLCEIDEKHPTFKRKYIDVNYTEPHHLIPMAYSDLFDVSLDVEENIISLCSNCHNYLHYGRDYESVLKKLYDERIDYLKEVGIYITFDKLLEMYL